MPSRDLPGPGPDPLFKGAATTVIGRGEDDPVYRHDERLPGVDARAAWSDASSLPSTTSLRGKRSPRPVAETGRG